MTPDSKPNRPALALPERDELPPVDYWEIIYARLSMKPEEPDGLAWHGAYQFDVQWLLDRLEERRRHERRS